MEDTHDVRHERDRWNGQLRMVCWSCSVPGIGNVIQRDKKETDEAFQVRLKTYMQYHPVFEILSTKPGIGSLFYEVEIATLTKEQT